MRVATDIGGTFTDLVAIANRGTCAGKALPRLPILSRCDGGSEKKRLNPEGIKAFFHGPPPSSMH
jgi:hypothetical protein